MSPHSPHLMRIRQCFPDLTFSEVQIDTDGKTTDVIIVNNDRVFRFPRTQQASQSLWRESAVLNLVQQHVHLRVPGFDHVEKDFASYEIIPGQHLLRTRLLRLPARAQKHILGQLGEFLSQMHSIPETELAETGIGYSGAYRPPEKWLEFYESVERTLFPLMLTHTREWVQLHFEPLLKDANWMKSPLAFVNGNLGPYHILYSPEEKTLTGILDFGASSLGDPAQDIAVLLYYYGESILHKLAAYYPPLVEMIDRARFLAGIVELQWALEGMQRGDLYGPFSYISSARDVLPIGSRW